MSTMRIEVVTHSIIILTIGGSPFLENWNRQCERLVELLESNDLAQMNSMDLETYSKLILQLDSTVASFKRAVVT